jgi:hypothetical protein
MGLLDLVCALELNMSIFNPGSSWGRIFNPIPQRKNVWC